MVLEAEKKKTVRRRDEDVAPMELDDDEEDEDFDEPKLVIDLEAPPTEKIKQDAEAKKLEEANLLLDFSLGRQEGVNSVRVNAEPNKKKKREHIHEEDKENCIPSTSSTNKQRSECCLKS